MNDTSTDMGGTIQERETVVNGTKYEGWLWTYYEGGVRRRKTFKTKVKAEKARAQWLAMQGVEADRRKVLQRKIGEKAEKLSAPASAGCRPSDTHTVRVVRGAMRPTPAGRIRIDPNRPASLRNRF